MRPRTTDEVLDLLDAAFPSAAVGAAMELGLFWLLEERPLGVDDVARTLDIPPGRCRHWLQLLEGAGLIVQTAGRYAPSPTARTSILEALEQNSWGLLAEEARRRLPGLVDLPRHLATRGSSSEAQGLTPPTFQGAMVEDPNLTRRFTRMLYDLHRIFAGELARELDLGDAKRMMDLGGGSGVVSLELLRRYPELTAVVVDIANVCEVGREIAAANGLADRITYHAADFLNEELPSGFDVVVECDVDVYGESLFRKVWTALKPGGRFVIVDQLAPREGVAPSSRGHWALHRSIWDPQFAFLTPGQIRQLLADAGFAEFAERMLPPVPGTAVRFTRDTFIIEATK